MQSLLDALVMKDVTRMAVQPSCNTHAFEIHQTNAARHLLFFKILVEGRSKVLKGVSVQALHNFFHSFSMVRLLRVRYFLISEIKGNRGQAPD